MTTLVHWESMGSEDQGSSPVFHLKNSDQIIVTVLCSGNRAVNKTIKIIAVLEIARPKINK